MTPPVAWLEIAVPAHAEAVEAVSEILSRVGYNGIAVEVPLERGVGADHTVKAYVVEDADAFAKVSDVRDALGHLQAFGLGPIGELVARRVDDKDWLESWKAEFVPIRVEFPKEGIAGTPFEGQTNLKLGTHCQNDKEFDQYVLREYLTYRVVNLVTPRSYRARLARGTYVDAATKKPVATHNALFLEHDNDVARRLGGRDVSLPRIEFKDLDKLDIVGIYPNYATAYTAWKAKAQQTVDNAHMRYFIVHLHRLLDPDMDRQAGR